MFNLLKALSHRLIIQEADRLEEEDMDMAMMIVLEGILIKIVFLT